MRFLFVMLLPLLFIAPKANAYSRTVCGMADLAGVYASIDLTAAAAKAKAKAFCLRKSRQPYYCSRVQCRVFQNAKNVKPYVTFHSAPIHIPAPSRSSGRYSPNGPYDGSTSGSSDSSSSNQARSTPVPRDQSPRFCPDGSYHTGGCTFCPDGKYHGGESCNLGPDGNYHGGQANLCPDGKYHVGTCTYCPDGKYHGTSCTFGPDGKYHGEDE